MMTNKNFCVFTASLDDYIVLILIKNWEWCLYLARKDHGPIFDEQQQKRTKGNKDSKVYIPKILLKYG